MSKIAGTVLTIEEYLSPKSKEIDINKNKPGEKTISLYKNRIYEIPAFQREIRWSSDNVNRLISDIHNSPKFLGNIILSTNSNTTYEIIDGQQRTTVLLLIISYIRKIFGSEIEVFDTCKLNNASFSMSQVFIDNDCNINNLTNDDRKEVIKSDKYIQMDRYKEIWESIKSSEIIKEQESAEVLLSNLKQSTINIIASQADTENASIQYFLDVNLKGVKLDTEDIFKAYLFSKDTSDDTRRMWQENKQLAHRLNNISTPKSKIDYYPLMKIYEHYFLCELEKDEKFKGITYGTDFCLKGSFNPKGTSKKYYEGTHLIEVIRSNSFMKKMLKRCNTAIEIIYNITSNRALNEDFKNLFSCDQSLNDKELQCFFYMMKTVLGYKDITPKILILKYILEFLDENIHSKEDYQSLYGIYLASVMFIVFSRKKENDEFTSTVNKNEFTNKINEWAYNRIVSIDLTSSKLRAAYKYTEEQEDDESNREQQFICKSLAAIVNYIKIKKINDNTYQVKVNNINDFLLFLSDRNRYSVEHFIIGEKGTLVISTDKITNYIYSYPRGAKIYRNSLFNYIFIPESINGPLGNKPLYTKKREISKNADKIMCTYSKYYLHIINSFFPKYPQKEQIESFEDENELKNYLDEYFSEVFPEEFFEFASNLIKSLKLPE